MLGIYSHHWLRILMEMFQVLLILGFKRTKTKKKEGTLPIKPTSAELNIDMLEGLMH